MGFLAPAEARVAESFVVAYDDRSSTFVMAPKTNVKPGRLTRIIVSRMSYALELCSEPECGVKSCSKLHLTEPPTKLEVQGDADMLVCLKNGSSHRIRPSAMHPTAGLHFVSTLKALGLVKDCYPWVCQRFLNNKCNHGSKCLMLHVDPNLVRDAPRPPVEAATTLTAALEVSLPTNPGLQHFIDSTLHRMGLRSVGDLAPLSNHVFEALMNRDIEAHQEHQTFWLLLQQLRNIPRTTPLAIALQQFPGIDAKTLEVVANISVLATVGDLCAIKPKLMYTMASRAQLLDACEKLRARFEDDGEVYSSVNLAELPSKAFFRHVAGLVCEFREKHAHKSWRKQDATRPIVTSAITYVDHNECRCACDNSIDSANFARSPNLGPKDAKHTAKPVNTIDNVPSTSHWCQCTRKCVLAVNYELSTPSGSRCSEQNAMGVIASMGLPTTCIREVFVHGGAHNGEDPNPLFPCGVCENMFRRVSKDVQKAHGGDVMLYMFDQESNPRKLVSIPILEISHREGSSFRRFVAEDLREGMDSQGRTTPQNSFLLDELAATP